jgi:ketosteroid isomerase-like protein
LHPADKKRAKKYLEEKYSEPNQVVSQISREGIRILENIVITHYLLNISWNDDEGVEQKRESRITHTWVKEDSSWKILGGMSNRKEIE